MCLTHLCHDLMTSSHTFSPEMFLYLLLSLILRNPFIVVMSRKLLDCKDRSILLSYCAFEQDVAPATYSETHQNLHKPTNQGMTLPQQKKENIKKILIMTSQHVKPPKKKRKGPNSLMCYPMTPNLH